MRQDSLTRLACREADSLDSEDRFPAVDSWLRATRSHPVFATDAKRTGAFLKTLKQSSHERRRLFWSGARLEWLLAGGFHHWLLGEIEAGRAVFPTNHKEGIERR